MTLKIANYVKQELEKSSQFVVYMTRTDDSYVGLSERVNYAASKNADILVSLHLNSADSKTANGAEILVPRTGRYNSQVAEDAGKLAQDILKKLVSLGLYNRGLVYRDSASGTKYPDGSTADYYAIVRQGLQAGIPSIIVEHAFISSTVDAKFLDSEADLQKIGRADAEGIAQYFGVTLSNSSNNNSDSNSSNSDKNGWVKENRNWYYYKSNAKQTGWQKVNGKWYYLNSNGVMQTGYIKTGNTRFYLDANGVMQTGWQYVNGYKLYFKSNGALQQDVSSMVSGPYRLRVNRTTCIGDQHYLIDTPLADVGVALLAQAGVHEQLIDVSEPGRLLIDVVFPVAAAVIPPGDHHLLPAAAPVHGQHLPLLPHIAAAAL